MQSPEWHKDLTNRLLGSIGFANADPENMILERASGQV